MRSLRQRAVASSIIWAILSLMVGVFGLASFLNMQTLARFDELLRNRHTQAVVAVANYHQSPEEIGDGIGDPAYLHPFSGEYWQIQNDVGDVFVSPSLVDTLLPITVDDDGNVTLSNFTGPNGAVLRGIRQRITLEDNSVWTVQVASSTKSLIADRDALRNNLIAAFGLVAMVGIVGAFLQASATLKPLNALRRDVSARWDSEDGLESKAYPIEVAPLVNDINELIARNSDIVRRSRRQAADLAHAIKTPSAIMRNELEMLEDQGHPVSASLDALNRLDAQLRRSFARMRSEGGNAAVQTFTDLDTSLGRLARAFTSLAANERKTLTAQIVPNLKIRMDQYDFEEVVGNLLDNALKWCSSEITISVCETGYETVIQIDDDGPGIPKETLGVATQTGQRLDTSKPGTGLGLAIASDLCAAYGGNLSLDSSETLGGLSARVTLRSIKLDRTRQYDT